MNSDKKTKAEIYGSQYVDFNLKSLPQNKFRCPPCVCNNISSNRVSAVCEDCNMISIPQNWPVETNEMFIKHGKSLEVLDLNDLLVYPSLTRVKITFTSLDKVLSSSNLNVSSTLVELDLNSNSISTVEDGSFLVFSNLLNLSLAHNHLRNLNKETLMGLRNLRYLSVSGNPIIFIANDTFDDMSNLVTLHIHGIRFVFPNYIQIFRRIFTPLRNLKQLHMNECNVQGTSLCDRNPNKALQVLTNLKLLSIDGDDRRGPGPEIKDLIHLRFLIIRTPVRYNLTDESFFDNVPFITSFKTSSGIPHNIHPKAFTKLKNLVILDYSSSSVSGYYNICQILNDIQYVVNSSLKYLLMRNVNDRKKGCKELEAQEVKYLKFLNLTELDLANNFIEYLDPRFIDQLPASLAKIDLSGNCISYTIDLHFYLFPKELIELNLNYQNRECDGEFIRFRSDAKNKRTSNKSFLHLTKNNSGTSFTYKIKDDNVSTLEHFNYYRPRNFSILRANYFLHLGMDLLFKDILKYYPLRELSLAGGEFSDWVWMNFMPAIEKADFSYNLEEDINPNFFPFNSSLKYLKISNNLLGPAIIKDTDNLFFRNTKQLKGLDMSLNSITVIGNDYFRNFVNLQILDISNNKIQVINISFSHMTELIFLNFSVNSITSISKQSRDDLDLLAADHQVYLDLTSNPLPCTCEGLELMKWMASTNVYLLNQDFLECKNEFHEVHEMGNIVQRVETLQRQCVSKTVIILTCVFSIIVFCILLITSLMYRYRWKLRYLRSIALVKLLGTRPAATNVIGYRFDAYILYTDNTRRFVLRDCVRELEEKRGHRLCIEERDFLPGTYIVSNIVSGVQSSAKTVAMVTPEFYEGEYSEYSVKMALMEEIFMRRSVLFLCVCEPTDDEDLSHDLLTAMKQNNYIEYPPMDDVTDEIIEEFWNQFSRAIGRNNNEEI